MTDRISQGLRETQYQFYYFDENILETENKMYSIYFHECKTI